MPGVPVVIHEKTLYVDYENKFKKLISSVHVFIDNGPLIFMRYEQLGIEGKKEIRRMPGSLLGTSQKVLTLLSQQGVILDRFYEKGPKYIYFFGFCGHKSTKHLYLCLHFLSRECQDASFIFQNVSCHGYLKSKLCDWC